MDKLRRIAKPVTHLVVLGLLTLSMHIPVVQASMIGTDTLLKAEQVQQDRERLSVLLNRDDLKQRLVARGVDPDQVQARVDGLSDEEIQTLTAKIDQLPAGGDGLGLAVFVFLVLLLTDILGYTDIFPFVNKPAKR
jgi:hypothetical protein